MGPTVFLIGAARSGTKLLRSLIARHPAINAVPYDINYVWRLGNEDLPHDELSPDSLTDRAASRIREYIGGHRAPHGGVIEKTVSNALRVSFVDAVFPDALYVHLIRDGRDVIASAYEQWLKAPDWRYVGQKALQFPLLQAPGYALRYAAGLLRGRTSAATTPRVWGPRYRGIEEDLAAGSLLRVCALQWINSVQRARSAFETLTTPRVLTVRYEQLIHDPPRELIRVADHIGMDPAPYAANFPDNVDPTCAGRYRDRFEPDQMLEVERTAGAELERLGYVGQPRSNIRVP